MPDMEDMHRIGTDNKHDPIHPVSFPVQPLADFLIKGIVLRCQWTPFWTGFQGSDCLDKTVIPSLCRIR